MITPFWIAAVAIIVGGYMMKKQQAATPANRLKQFWEANKDWLIQFGVAIGVVFLAPRFVGNKTGRIVQIAAGGYAGYLVYKNWADIQSALK